jgi:hypothetical protein
MDRRPTTLERAYELADSGECESVHEIKVRLKAERLPNIEGHLYGPSLRADLQKRCLANRANPPVSPAPRR